MACFRLKPAWKAGLPNENGRYPLRFQTRRDAPDYMIGCGKCDGCAAQRSLEWAIRMAHEAQMHERNCFVTLTYADPCPEKINREDPVRFIKRLRKRIPIRYFLTGEYGEKTRRPHYHAILFGADFLGGAYDINDQLYGNKILDSIWTHGHTSIGEFSLGSAMYVAGYVNKKLGDPDTFSIMSRFPPLGRTWLRANHDNIRRNEKVVLNGQEFPVPSVYLKWLEGVEDFEHVKENREKNVVKLWERQIVAKEKNLKAKQKLKDETV